MMKKVRKNIFFYRQGQKKQGKILFWKPLLAITGGPWSHRTDGAEGVGGTYSKGAQNWWGGDAAASEILV